MDAALWQEIAAWLTTNPLEAAAAALAALSAGFAAVLLRRRSRAADRVADRAPAPAIPEPPATAVAPAPVAPAKLRDRLLRFHHHYERVAQPFQWKFTRTDLAALLTKLEDHRRPLTEAA